MSYYAYTLAQLPHTQLFGSGTLLDTVRLREIIAARVSMSSSAVEAYIIGEHGDTQIPVWSCSHIAGTPIAQCADIEIKDLAFMAQEVKDKAYNIIACKGATYFGIAACVAQLCQAIITDQKIVVPLSTYVEEFGIYFSMPVVLGERGIERILPIPLNSDEQQQLNFSATELRKLI